MGVCACAQDRRLGRWRVPQQDLQAEASFMMYHDLDRVLQQRRRGASRQGAKELDKATAAEADRRIQRKQEAIAAQRRWLEEAEASYASWQEENVAGAAAPPPPHLIRSAAES